MVSRGRKLRQASSSAAAACRWPAPAVTVAIRTRIERVKLQTRPRARKILFVGPRPELRELLMNRNVVLNDEGHPGETHAHWDRLSRLVRAALFGVPQA